MPYRVRVSVIDDEWEAMMAEVRRRSTNLKPVLLDAAGYMDLEIDDRFREERGPGGTPWKPLQPETREQKKGTKILQEAGDRGGLRDSIKSDADERSLFHGTNKVYGPVHQLGITAAEHARGIAIEARPYLGFSEENVDHIRALVTEYLEEPSE